MGHEDNHFGSPQPDDSERSIRALTVGRCKLNLLDKVKILRQAAASEDALAIPGTAGDVRTVLTELMEHGKHCPVERDQALREIGAAIDALPEHDIMYHAVPELKAAIDAASRAPEAGSPA